MNDQFPQRPQGPWTEGQAPTQQFPPHPHARPGEPLAHEGGYPYGMPPAAPYQRHDQFIPQHLHVPPQPYPSPYPQQFGYPAPMQQMQQTVLMQGNGKRVNHVLHLVLTLLTAGLWLPVWIILAFANS